MHAIDPVASKPTLSFKQSNSKIVEAGQVLNTARKYTMKVHFTINILENG